MSVVKIRYRQVYMEVPNDDIEAIDVVLKVLRFFKKQVKQEERRQKQNDSSKHNKINPH